MHRKTTRFALPALLATLAVAPLHSQTLATAPDPLHAEVRNTHSFIQHQLSVVVTRMSEEDYAFRPTPEVRTFGQLLAHIADSNYLFCSGAIGEKTAPVQAIEKTRTNKADIDKALADSFAYCGGVYAGMTDAGAKTMVQFGKQPMSALAALIFNSVHNGMHYGNVVTYMRLRGKVPPPAGP